MGRICREVRKCGLTEPFRTCIFRHPKRSYGPAYKLQEIEFCKIDRNMLDRNKRRIQAILESGQNKKFDRDIRLMAGTVLTREYQGKEYRVMATVDGQYEFDGRCYQSLSRIAKEITGTAWSGPVFFGLKSTAAKKTSGKKGAGK